MYLDNLFGDHVPPQQEKQLRLQLPTYEDLMGEPQPGPQEPPPEYNEFEGIDYTIKDEDQIRYVLDELGLPNYEDVDYTLAQDIINNKTAIGYLKRMIKNARKESRKLVAEKSDATKKYNDGKYSEGEKVYIHRYVDMKRDALKKYVKHLEDKMKKYQTGSGIKGRGILKKMEKERNRIKGYKATVKKIQWRSHIKS